MRTLRTAPRWLAEIAFIEGRDLDAMRLYEKAIHSARTNGFIHNEALAYERASDFYRARGFEEFADIYLRNARACYLSWGAAKPFGNTTATRSGKKGLEFIHKTSVAE